MSKRDKGAAAEEGGDERWLITYADLVTLLFALFIVLFANSDIDEGKFGPTRQAIQKAFSVGIFSSDEEDPHLAGGPPISTELGQRPESDFQLLNDQVTVAALELGLQDNVTVTLTDDTVTISLSDNLIFEPASAVVSERAVGLLGRLAETLRDMTNVVRIEGHTDSIPVNSGAFATNWELSTGRATSVLRFFAEEAGVDASRLHAAGFADQQPVADNSTPEGRARNRRADIVILYPTASPAESQGGDEE